MSSSLYYGSWVDCERTILPISRMDRDHGYYCPLAFLWESLELYMNEKELLPFPPAPWEIDWVQYEINHMGRPRETALKPPVITEKLLEPKLPEIPVKQVFIIFPEAGGRII